MLIHFNGMPGVGKLTIAKIVAQRLSAHLVDNHAIINAARASGCGHGTPDYFRLISALNAIIYPELVHNKTISTIIMTNALANEFSEDRDRFDEITRLADARKEPFVPVHLYCDEQENMRRVAEPSRALKEKLTRPDVLVESRQRYSIMHPTDNLYQFELDVTHLTPDQSADAVVQHLISLGLYHDPVASHQTPAGPIPRE